MHPLPLRLTALSAVAASGLVLAASVVSPATAQSQSQSQAEAAQLKARCSELTSYFDRYGASRGENSDGARNHTRIAAGIECQQGHYAEGIASMEGLLRRKHFDVPPASTGLAQTPPGPARDAAPRQ